jgi:hypothetical protein
MSMITMVMTMALFVAPAAKAQQSEPIVPREKIALFNSKDFTGWKLFVPDPNHDVAKTWSIADGVIHCEGKPNGYMRTEKYYADYLLHVEWRWPEKGGNSGVLIHNSGVDTVWPKSLECQLASRNAGDFWTIGGVEFEEHAEAGPRVSGRRTIKLKSSSEKPIGQWNAYDIVCKDDWVVVFVNGILQNVATKCSIPGTPYGEKSGRICLQSEGTPIEFRNIYIEPLNTDGH